MKSLASDNYSGVSPEILQAVIMANKDHAPAYGEDRYTEKAVSLFKKIFGEHSATFFVCNGTAANTLALKAITRSYHAIICADSAHINTQEVGAPVKATGSMVISIPAQEGKISPKAIADLCEQALFWGRHTNVPRVVSITQSTEYGTVYSIEELKAISQICKQYHLWFHMDGCRLANAAIALNASFAQLTLDVGVDILSFGGTKNGMMFGEAIVFMNKELAADFEYIQKQELQLLSKMRFLSAQFIPYLEQEIWRKNAVHAHNMCKKLYLGLKKHSQINFACEPQTNQIFAYFSEEMIAATQKIFPYYIWDNKTNLVRLVTSFDTTEEDIDEFLASLEQGCCSQSEPLKG